MGEFQIYRGTGAPDNGEDRIRLLSDPPPWRRFEGGPVTPLDRHGPVAQRLPYLTRAVPYQAEPGTVTLVNVALHLRRPLLVTGFPGAGKSTLAYAVAHELGLGSVLRWPITSRSVLRDGLYHYDAVGRIEEAGIARGGAGTETDGPPTPVTEDIGRFVRLGPLGTALAPYELPRVLLIDEIDKSDIDLPNDLLDVFEEGEYGIPELARISDSTPSVKVRPSDGGAAVTVTEGRVCCRAFPFVVMTSNGEREFPPAFLRRCVRLELPQPDERRTAAIVEAHLGTEAASQGADLIQEFLIRREQGQLATDQLLNAVYLVHRASDGPGVARDELVDTVLRQLDQLN